jgi:cytochrome P450
LRKILHSQLTSGRRIEESEHVRADEMLQMLRSIPIDEVVNVKSCLEVTTANILTRLIIGKRFMGRSGGMDKSEEKELQDFIHITEEIGLCLGTPNPRDVIPAFKYTDLTGLDRRFKRLRRHMESFLANIIAERRASPTNSPSEKDLLDTLLDQMDAAQDQITEEVVTSIVWVSPKP